MDPHLMDLSFFERRKKDHIKASLNDKNEALGLSGLEFIELEHDALPECDFSEVTLKTKSLNTNLETPFLVSSMTGGHKDSLEINLRIARCCVKRSWLMGVGSQRREIKDKLASKEWEVIKEKVPQVQLIGNLGLSQLHQVSTSRVEELVQRMGAMAFFIHTNPLQECIQPEGTPQFSRGLHSLKALCDDLSVPVLLKETGCGFSEKTFKKLESISLGAIDVSGLGGTHWGRVEGDRCKQHKILAGVSESFRNWGVSTVDSVFQGVNFVQNSKSSTEIWASGGVRNGLEAAKLLALGARVVGFAKPILEAALISEEVLLEYMDQVAYELKVALFCTGNRNIQELQQEKAWKWKRL